MYLSKRSVKRRARSNSRAERGLAPSGCGDEGTRSAVDLPGDGGLEGDGEAAEHANEVRADELLLGSIAEAEVRHGRVGVALSELPEDAHKLLVDAAEGLDGSGAEGLPSGNVLRICCVALIVMVLLVIASVVLLSDHRSAGLRVVKTCGN